MWARIICAPSSVHKRSFFKPQKPKRLRETGKHVSLPIIAHGTGNPNNMTEVVTEDGSKIETNLPAEKVADLQAKPAEVTDPAKPDTQPASQTKDESVPAKTDDEPKTPPVEPKTQTELPRREKPKPIAKLLEERHSLREENARLKADLQKAASQPPAQATPADIKALAEKYGLEETFTADLVAAVRAGIKPELPKEVQDLVAAHQTQAQAAAEEQAFKTDLGRLEATLKDEQLKDPKVREKLQELAYSDAKAPDGEEYYKKPLYELYMNYVKPEVEPGKPSAEPARGGSKANGKVLDFTQIAADPALLSEFSRTATKEQFAKFHNWQLENEKEPIRRPGF